MKKTLENQELNAATVQELQDMLEKMRRMRFSLQLNSATAHIKDYSQFKKTRRALARVLTQIRQRGQ